MTIAQKGRGTRGRTDDPEQEKKEDEARCQYRHHRFNHTAQCAHRQPGQHPVYYKSAAAEARIGVVSRG
jgi:hypothetical protein